jgi:hypothetical protein
MLFNGIYPIFKLRLMSFLSKLQLDKRDFGLYWESYTQIDGDVVPDLVVGRGEPVGNALPCSTGVIADEGLGIRMHRLGSGVLKATVTVTVIASLASLIAFI